MPSITTNPHFLYIFLSLKRSNWAKILLQPHFFMVYYLKLLQVRSDRSVPQAGKSHGMHGQAPFLIGK